MASKGLSPGSGGSSAAGASGLGIPASSSSLSYSMRAHALSRRTSCSRSFRACFSASSAGTDPSPLASSALSRSSWPSMSRYATITMSFPRISVMPWSMVLSFSMRSA